MFRTLHLQDWSLNICIILILWCWCTRSLLYFISLCLIWYNRTCNRSILCYYISIRITNLLWQLLEITASNNINIEAKPIRCFIRKIFVEIIHSKIAFQSQITIISIHTKNMLMLANIDFLSISLCKITTCSYRILITTFVFYYMTMTWSIFIIAWVIIQNLCRTLAHCTEVQRIISHWSATIIWHNLKNWYFLFLILTILDIWESCLINSYSSVIINNLQHPIYWSKEWRWAFIRQCIGSTRCQ